MDYPNRVARVARKLGDAAKCYDVSLPRIALRAARIRLEQRIGLTRALILGLLDPKMSREDLRSHITMSEYWDVLGRLNEGSDLLLADKAMFYEHCRGCDLPIPDLYAIVCPPFAWTTEHRSVRTEEQWRRFLREDLPERFLVKPALSEQGVGIIAYTRTKDGFLMNDEHARSVEDVHHDLTEEGAKIVIQQRVRCHPTLEEWTGHRTAQCMRLITVVDQQGEVIIWAAALRLVTCGGVTDNFSYGLSGNLLSMVDIENGTIFDVYCLAPSGIGLTTVQAHPETEKVLLGEKVPFFGDVVTLAKRAAKEFLPLRFVGWDVAITDQGLVLLEGNSMPGPMASRTPWLSRDGLHDLASMV